MQGDIVLDLATGPAGVGHRVAALVELEGRVFSTDLAPAMVDAARRTGSQGADASPGSVGGRNVEDVCPSCLGHPLRNCE